MVQAPCVGPSVFRSFCCALSEELAGLGLRCTWHKGSVCERPSNLEDQLDIDPDESAHSSCACPGHSLLTQHLGTC